jgi:phenylacetate-coenzyme A ligase PaaK-like adenylate-forming protein
METLSRGELEAYQLRRLKRMVSNALRTEFYRPRLTEKPGPPRWEASD